MAAPSPDLLVSDPAPLNPFTTWPFLINEFPADRILGLLFGHPPREEPKDAPQDPNRKEQR